MTSTEAEISEKRTIRQSTLLGVQASSYLQAWPRQTKPKKGQFMNFSQGHSGTKVRCESRLFSQGKTPELTKMGEIHELFSFWPFLWFGLPGRLLIRGKILGH